MHTCVIIHWQAWSATLCIIKFASNTRGAGGHEVDAEPVLPALCRASFHLWPEKSLHTDYLFLLEVWNVSGMPKASLQGLLGIAMPCADAASTATATTALDRPTLDQHA